MFQHFKASYDTSVLLRWLVPQLDGPPAGLAPAKNINNQQTNQIYMDMKLNTATKNITIKTANKICDKLIDKLLHSLVISIQCIKKTGHT
jgi:hypothetical protein